MSSFHLRAPGSGSVQPLRIRWRSWIGGLLSACKGATRSWSSFTSASAPATRVPCAGRRHLVSRALARPRHVVLGEPVDQRAQRDAEELRGAGLVAGALIERLDDALALRIAVGAGARH